MPKNYKDVKNILIFCIILILLYRAVRMMFIAAAVQEKYVLYRSKVTILGCVWVNACTEETEVVSFVNAQEDFEFVVFLCNK